MEEIKLVVVDDHPLFRQGVVDALSLEPDMTVIGQASSGEDALEMIRSLSPDIAVIDVIYRFKNFNYTNSIFF